jgi:hypothetical protein
VPVESQAVLCVVTAAVGFGTAIAGKVVFVVLVVVVGSDWTDTVDNVRVVHRVRRVQWACRVGCVARQATARRVENWSHSVPQCHTAVVTDTVDRDALADTDCCSVDSTQD